MKLLIFVGLNIGGYIGLAAAEQWGMTIAFVVSTVGSLVGVYVAWWVGRNYLGR